jgi:hypothetical protein
MSPSRALLLALAALVVVLVALLIPGCGKGPVTFDNGVLLLKLDEYRIVPSDVRVRVGKVTIVATDTGVLTHNVKVQSFSDDQQGNPVDYGGTATAHPGQTVTKSLVLRPGRYRLVCTVANHQNLGQFGTLTVTG